MSLRDGCSIPMELLVDSVPLVKVHGNKGKAKGRTKETHGYLLERSIMMKGKTKENTPWIAQMAKTMTGRKGPAPWNKGLTKETHPSLLSLSKKKTGRTKENDPSVASGVAKRTGWTKENHDSTARMAEKLTGKTKADTPYLAERSKRYTGRTAETYPYIAEVAEIRRGRTKETHPYLARMAEKKRAYVGEKAARWEGGKSFEPYSTWFNGMIKECIRDRDEHICQGCGINEEFYWRKLDIHHISYDKMDTSDNNLISVCCGCNAKANINREFWQRFYTDKLLIKTNRILIYG
jgi:hypothetical protein